VQLILIMLNHKEILTLYFYYFRNRERLMRLITNKCSAAAFTHEQFLVVQLDTKTDIQSKILTNLNTFDQLKFKA